MIKHVALLLIDTLKFHQPNWVIYKDLSAILSMPIKSNNITFHLPKFLDVAFGSLRDAKISNIDIMHAHFKRIILKIAISFNIHMDMTDVSFIFNLGKPPIQEKKNRDHRRYSFPDLIVKSTEFNLTAKTQRKE